MATKTGVTRRILFVNADPSAGAGTSAQLNTVAQNTVTGNLWVKVGAANTAWQLVNASSGLLLITSGTTYTTPANITIRSRFKFTLIGGGGGSGGMATANGKSPGGGGGGGGILYISNLTPSTAYTIAIGAGGIAGTSAPTAGGDGGNTSIFIGIINFIAGGGLGSAASISSFGGIGGNTVFCTINIPGQWGGATSTASATTVSGKGGDSPFGFGLGGVGTGNNAFFGDALAGTGYGAGAGGSSKTTAANVAGAAGTQGCILVEWEV